METERIDLGKGEWWEIRRRLSRGMEKAITRASLAAVPKFSPTGVLTEEEVKAKLMENIGSVDIGAVEDAYLLTGTVAYSFGPAVNMETIDTIEAGVVRRVLTRMYELYTPQRVTEEQRQDFFGTRSSAS